MNHTTIENDGQPWLICLPADQGDLDRFLAVSASYAVGTGFSYRPATPAEKRKCAAAHALHMFRGGHATDFFGIPAV